MTNGEAEIRSEMAGTNPDGSGRNPREQGIGLSSVTAMRESAYPETFHLMEAVVERRNMQAAYRRVLANKGAPGVDGLSVEELKEHLVEQWPRIREKLLSGGYTPQPKISRRISIHSQSVLHLGFMDSSSDFYSSSNPLDDLIPIPVEKRKPPWLSAERRFY